MAENISSKPVKRSNKKERPKPQFSEHLSRLAEPKKSSFVSELDPIQKGIKRSTLKYKATKRIQSLAKPKTVNPKKIDREPIDVLTQSITTVSPSALNYKPTKRIVELAQPK